MFQRFTKNAGSLVKNAVIMSTTKSNIYYSQSLRFSSTNNHDSNKLFPVTQIREKFNLKENVPQTKDAKQVLLENPEVTFIGVFHEKTEEITLMPAMPGDLDVIYNAKEEIISAKKSEDIFEIYTDEAVKMINKDYKFYIARFSEIEKGPEFTSHERVLYKMNEKDKKSYYGFCVVLHEDKTVKINGRSRSLNYGKPGAFDRLLPHAIRQKIEKKIHSWFTPDHEVENDRMLRKN